MDLQDMIRETVQKLDLKLSPKDKQKYADMMIDIFINGKSPKEVLGFSEEMIEYMYNYGYRLYNLGNYEKAKDAFFGLTNFAPQEPRFILALAASFHRMKDYEEAVKHYLRLGTLEAKNPLPFYYMYDCYYQNGYVMDAQICLQQVIARCGEDSRYAKLKERCKLMLENLNEEIEQLKQKGELVFDEEEPKTTKLTPFKTKDKANLEQVEVKKT